MKLKLKTPKDRKERAYLGISAKDNFSINEARARVILVEIMNGYCVSCQNQTSICNKLFTLIQSNSKTRDQIKMIGISVANNDEELKIFQDHFQVPFSIIPDPKYVMHSAIGGSLTPFSIFAK
jgi:hypothetical protein